MIRKNLHMCLAANRLSVHWATLLGSWRWLHEPPSAETSASSQPPEKYWTRHGQSIYLQVWLFYQPLPLQEQVCTCGSQKINTQQCAIKIREWKITKLYCNDPAISTSFSALRIDDQHAVDRKCVGMCWRIHTNHGICQKDLAHR